MPEIETAELRRLRIPLSEPYHLSHTTVSAFETVLVRLETDDCATGWGETTTLQGYSAETAADCQDLLSDLLGAAPGRSTDWLEQEANRELVTTPFTQTALQTAIDGLARDGCEPVAAPVVGIVSASEPVEQVVQAATTQHERGHDVLKIKIGFDPVTDARVVNRLAATLPDSVLLRADANQAYSWADAVTFADRLTAGTLDEMIAEGDRIAFRWSMRGTHSGEGGPEPFDQLEPTHEEIDVAGINIAHIKDGKIIEWCPEWGTLELFQQLGVISLPWE
jgi:L-alanine-DL-glutamate epimerase-like enolase superfamily enzyme